MENYEINKSLQDFKKRLDELVNAINLQKLNDELNEKQDELQYCDMSFLWLSVCIKTDIDIIKFYLFVIGVAKACSIGDGDILGASVCRNP